MMASESQQNLNTTYVSISDEIQQPDRHCNKYKRYYLLLIMFISFIFLILSQIFKQYTSILSIIGIILLIFSCCLYKK